MCHAPAAAMAATIKAAARLAHHQPRVWYSTRAVSASRLVAAPTPLRAPSPCRARLGHLGAETALGVRQGRQDGKRDCSRDQGHARGRPGRGRCGPEQERGAPAGRHGADRDRPHRRYTPGPGAGPAVTGLCAVCVAIARPYAPRIGGRARHDARVSGTAGLPFRTIAVIPGPSRHERKSTANAVGPCGPPGFKFPILRCDQQFRPGAPSGGAACFRFPGPLRGHRRDPAARLPHRYPPPRGPCQARNPGRLREHGSGLGLERGSQSVVNHPAATARVAAQLLRSGGSCLASWTRISGCFAGLAAWRRRR